MKKEDAARLRMQGCLLSGVVPAGILAGLETAADCMKDEDIRDFLGHTLLHEMMPYLGLEKGLVERLAMAICGELEHPPIALPLAGLIQNGVRAWSAQALPLLLEYESREGRLPPCLCMGLSALIMLFAGARQEPSGEFSIPGVDGPIALAEDEEVLRAFSRLSCDMPPETLAYAVLSDRAIWEQDLRDIPGLEEMIAAQLRDLQLLGLRGALKAACQAAQ